MTVVALAPQARPLNVAADQRAELARTGVVVVPGVFDSDRLEKDSRVALAQAGNRLDRGPTEARADLLDEGGAYHQSVVNSLGVAEHVPDLWAWYVRNVARVAEAFAAEVVTSPHPLSAVTIKHYGGGDEQGWHYDTNPITCLLYITGSVPGGEVVVYDRTGELRSFCPPAGSVLLMWGRELRHRVCPQPEGADRVIAALNYYLTDDLWRPPGIDAVAYGPASTP